MINSNKLIFEMENRKINFRAWDSVLKTMDYDFTSQETNGDKYFVDIQDGNLTVGNVDENNDYYELELMQFIGIEDKNGKEIYEGDFIKLTGGLRLEFYPDNGQIVFNNHSGSFVMKALNNHGVFMNFSLDYSDGTEIEVVGNIYENPNGFAEAGGQN